MHSKQKKDNSEERLMAKQTPRGGSETEPQSCPSVQELLPKEWSKMTKNQRKNYRKRLKRARGEATRTPEEPTKGSTKRPIDTTDVTTSPNKEVRKKPRQEGTKPTSQVVSFIKVAIVHREHPRKELESDYCEKLLVRLMDLMCEDSTDDRKIAFCGYAIRSGTIVINCVDEWSKDWLTQSVNKLTPWEGVNLKIADPKEHEGFRKISLFIPKPIRKIDEILMNLKKQNGFDTGKWKILPNGVKNLDTGVYFAASIPESHFRKAEKRAYKLSHGFNMVEMKEIRRSQDTTLKEGTKEDNKVVRQRTVAAETPAMDARLLPRQPIAEYLVADRPRSLGNWGRSASGWGGQYAASKTQDTTLKEGAKEDKDERQRTVAAETPATGSRFVLRRPNAEDLVTDRPQSLGVWGRPDSAWGGQYSASKTQDTGFKEGAKEDKDVRQRTVAAETPATGACFVLRRPNAEDLVADRPQSLGDWGRPDSGWGGQYSASKTQDTGFKEGSNEDKDVRQRTVAAETPAMGAHFVLRRPSTEDLVADRPQSLGDWGRPDSGWGGQYSASKTQDTRFKEGSNEDKDVRQRTVAAETPAMGAHFVLRRPSTEDLVAERPQSLGDWGRPDSGRGGQYSASKTQDTRVKEGAKEDKDVRQRTAAAETPATGARFVLRRTNAEDLVADWPQSLGDWGRPDSGRGGQYSASKTQDIRFKEGSNEDKDERQRTVAAETPATGARFVLRRTNAEDLVADWPLSLGDWGRPDSGWGGQYSASKTQDTRFKEGSNEDKDERQRTVAAETPATGARFVFRQPNAEDLVAGRSQSLWDRRRPTSSGWGGQYAASAAPSGSTTVTDPNEIKPWWNEKLAQLKQNTRRLWNVAKRKNKWTAYKKSLTAYNNRIKEAKQDYYQRLTDSNALPSIHTFQTTYTAVNWDFRHPLNLQQSIDTPTITHYPGSFPYYQTDK